MAESEEELKSLLMKVKEESEKVGLKLNIQKMKIMVSGPITSWEIDGETVETVSDFILGGSKITADGDFSHEIKRRLLLGRKVMTNPDRIFKSRDITLPTEVRLVSSVQFSRSVVSDSLRLHESQHTRFPCPSPSPGVHSDSRPSSQWCHPAISSSVIAFFSCPPTLPASKYFPMSQLFSWGGQSTEVLALASFLTKQSKGWSPSEWTGWISLHSKGLPRVFSITTVQKHQLFGAQPSSLSNSYIHTWLLEKP